jgi:hypothetical protein
MQRRSFVLPLVWSLFATLSRAESPAIDEPAAPEGGPLAAPSETRAELSSLLGFASSPFFVPEFPEVSGQVLLLRTAVARRIAPSVWLGLTMPLALTSIRQPAGSYVDEAAWGNPALAIQHDWRGLTEAGVGFLSVARASLGLPLTEHGPRASQMANRALALADALQALREPSPYTPGVASLTLAYRVDLASGPWLFGPGLSVPLLVRLGEAELPSTQTRAIGLRPRADLRALYYPKRWLGVGAEGSLTFDVVRVTEPIRPDDARQRVQSSLRPEIVFDGRQFRVVLSCLVPIGGPVRGSVGCGADAALRF